MRQDVWPATHSIARRVAAPLKGFLRIGVDGPWRAAVALPSTRSTGRWGLLGGIPSLGPWIRGWRTSRPPHHRVCRPTNAASTPARPAIATRPATRSSCSLANPGGDMASRRALRASAMLMRRYVRAPTGRRPANAVRVRIPGERAAPAALSPSPARPGRPPLSASGLGLPCQEPLQAPCPRLRLRAAPGLPTAPYGRFLISPSPSATWSAFGSIRDPQGRFASNPTRRRSWAHR